MASPVQRSAIIGAGMSFASHVESSNVRFVNVSTASKLIHSESANENRTMGGKCHGTSKHGVTPIAVFTLKVISCSLKKIQKVVNYKFNHIGMLFSKDYYGEGITFLNDTLFFKVVRSRRFPAQKRVAHRSMSASTVGGRCLSEDNTATATSRHLPSASGGASAVNGRRLRRLATGGG